MGRYVDRFILKKILCGGLLGLAFSSVDAKDYLNCDQTTSAFASKTLCSSQLEEQRHALKNKFLIAHLISDVPTVLLSDTHTLWLNRVQQCKTSSCIKQQLELREDDLNFYTSINQSLTQHFLKYEHGHIAKQPVHLQVHQLNKDRIKIEGVAYRNPNNNTETQTVPFLAYSTPDNKKEITDNEHDCKYQFDFQKSLLVITTEQTGCERFTGVYRLYD